MSLHMPLEMLTLTHVFATIFMVGLIWFVQIVHYPLFAHIGKSEFSAYEELHQRFTTWVVAPVMLVELATAVALVNAAPHAWAASVWGGLMLLLLIWLVTATLSVPAHKALTAEFSTDAHRKLVSTNWIRTIAWTVRGILVMNVTSCCMR